MRERLEQRLQEFQGKCETGQKMLGNMSYKRE